ncbi:hypothetical protein D2V17_05545 [Aurantiacibacter xanthus]|uniref:Copper resistance protein NlpE n=1 Tax=Aurantiacibacter xanthus TaxID=1784712 RepID=A0A3A1P763_9SPHN|nr:hypothetical protein [Aurantiacibacter xanthus]RIV89733.1 hypothetical protein D2V17_05545 [Aurantiacibacter xanthus]
MIRFALVLAPLALLAACGGDQPGEDAPMMDEPSELAVRKPTPAQMPTPSADGADSVDYSGSYTFTRLDGSQSTLTIDKNAGTYEYVSPDGTTSGRYRKLDGARIALAGFEGGEAYFSIAPGALYRLAEKNSPFSEIDPGRMYRRSDYVAEDGPGAVAPSIATAATAPAASNR